MSIVDAYGNAVEPGTPVITLYGSDNKPMPPRKRIFCDSSLALTDDPASDATRLRAVQQTPSDGSITAAKLVNSGTTAGRLEVPILIDNREFNGTTYDSPAWAAGLYKGLIIDIIAKASAVNATLTLTGVAGTYSSTGFASGSFTNNDTSKIIMLGLDTEWSLYGNWWIKKGSVRPFLGNFYQKSGPYAGVLCGHTTDATSDATGLHIVFSGAADVIINVSGVPS